MKRILKWLGIGLGGLLILGLVAAVVIYIRSEQITRTTYNLPLSTITLPTDSFAIAEGRRLATIRGCYDDCHGRQLNGGVAFEEPMLARVVAPNLTQVALRYSDAELERVIRRGVRQNGKSTLGMPSSMFYHLSDEDLGAMIAFIRAAPITEGPETEIHLGPLARLGLVMGKYKPQVRLIDYEAPRIVVRDTSDQTAFGKYLALTSCTECHGPELRGSTEMSTPDLAITATYSDQAFMRLMRTGIAQGDRELQGMSKVARTRFAHFTDNEIRALHEYLRVLNSAKISEGH